VLRASNLDSQHAGVPTLGAIARTGAIEQPVSDRRYEQADWSGRAGAIKRCEHIVWDHGSNMELIQPSKYARIARVTKHLGMAGVLDMRTQN